MKKHYEVYLGTRLWGRKSTKAGAITLVATLRAKGLAASWAYSIEGVYE